MFGIGWTEFIVVALVLLIFVGPKHLPGMLKKFVEIVGELKSASREFRSQIEEEMGEDPSAEAQSRRSAVDHRVEVRRERIGETRDIHHQDSEQREAAQDVTITLMNSETERMIR